MSRIARIAAASFFPQYFDLYSTASLRTLSMPVSARTPRSPARSIHPDSVPESAPR